MLEGNGIAEAETAVCSLAFEMAAPSAEEIRAVSATEPQSDNDATVATARGRRINLVQKMRDWLRRAA